MLFSHDKLILPLWQLSYAYLYTEEIVLYWIFSIYMLEIGSRILQLKHSTMAALLEALWCILRGAGEKVVAFKLKNTHFQLHTCFMYLDTVFISVYVLFL